MCLRGVAIGHKCGYVAEHLKCGHMTARDCLTTRKSDLGRKSPFEVFNLFVTFIGHPSYVKVTLDGLRWVGDNWRAACNPHLELVIAVAGWRTHP